MNSYETAGLKQAIVVRVDLKMGKGKLATQVAHASVQSFYETYKLKPNLALKWINSGQKKVVLKVDSINEILSIYKKAIDQGLIVSLIRDAGLTQLEPGTITAVGIGPDYENKIDEVTGHLKLL